MTGTGCQSYQQSIHRRPLLAGAAAGPLLAVGSRETLADLSHGNELTDTAVIQYWLNGAASHFETFDPKPDAPDDIRGPFQPIATNLPGVHICESLPLHAQMLDKMTIIRSVRHDNNDHQHGMHWCQTGHDAKANGVNPFKKSSHPSSGSLVAMLRGPNHPGMPPYVMMGYPLDNQGIHRLYPHRSAYLGVRYNPLEILNNRTGDGKDPGQDNDFRVRSLAPIGNLTRSDLMNRGKLLNQFSGLRSGFGQTQVRAWNNFYRAASDLVTGDRTGAAFDLDKEDPPNPRALRA